MYKVVIEDDSGNHITINANSDCKLDFILNTYKVISIDCYVAKLTNSYNTVDEEGRKITCLEFSLS